jgi:prophage antirepressor-like protein
MALTDVSLLRRTLECGPIRIDAVGTAEILYFRARDCALAMGYVRTQDPITMLVDGEDVRTLRWIIDDVFDHSDAVRPTFTPNELNALYLTEYGLQCLAWRSECPRAVIFRKWFTTNALPGMTNGGGK